MRFIHTADWHLGRLFHGRHLTEDQGYALEQFCEIVKEMKPDAVVIAGDIYDRSAPPTEAVELLDETLARLTLDMATPVIMIAGNHDSPQRLGFGSRLLAERGLYVRGALTAELAPVVLRDKWGEVYFTPLPYAAPYAVRSVYEGAAVEDHDAALGLMVKTALTSVPDGKRKVAVAHAFVAGGQESESERPLSAGGSGAVSSGWFKPFDYTALGHLHGSQTAGSSNIRYSGSLLKYSFDEAGQRKGINLVELAADGTVRCEVIALTPRHDVRKVRGRFADIIADRVQYPSSDDYIAVELLDKEPILDARGQLSAVYPNLMQIERPRPAAAAAQDRPRDYRTRNTRQLFGGFFQAVTGEELTAEQRRVFGAAVDELTAGERGG